LLDAEEISRCPDGRGAAARAYVTAHALVRRTLSRYADREPGAWRFRVGACGRPEPVDSELRCSLTHTPSVVACAVTRGLDVGVDAEDLGRVAMVDLVAPFVLSEGEKLSLGQLTEPRRTQRFVRLWTLKEAYVKGLGMGLAHPSSLATVRATTFAFSGDAVVARGDSETAAWQFASWSVAETHALSVAVRRGDAEDLAMRVSWSAS
jgi:4'-phosphopantetheinyl transferase